MKQTFGIDFDGTFSADPELFRAIVGLMRAAGHTVIMVTQRCAEFLPEVNSIVQMDDLLIIFASGLSKEVAAEQAGFTVTIWIDDNPGSVITALRFRGCP